MRGERDITCYIFSYENMIEKLGEHLTAGEPTRVGDAEITEQFKLICSFGINSYFSEYREQVKSVCGPRNKALVNGEPAFSFVPETVRLNKRIEYQQSQRLADIINKVIGLDRRSYIKILSALRLMADSLETISYNIDLAYSMLVYCLESLSQSFEPYSPKWDDWSDPVKAKLEKLFIDIDPIKVSELKSALIQDKQFKLTQRFVQFAQKYTNEDFFLSESACVEYPLRKSEFSQALLNAYSLRSRYAHALEPIQQHLKMPDLGNGDYFPFDGQPYLTYSGMHRIIRHIIFNLITELPLTKKEIYPWRNDLPGVVMMALSPEYWISEHRNFTAKDANSRLAALTRQITTSGSISNLDNLMGEIEKLLFQTKRDKRKPLYYLYILYNAFRSEDQRRIGWEETVEKFSDYYQELDAYNLLVRTFLGIPLEWSFYKCLDCFKKYRRTKFNEFALQLNSWSEVIILCNLANLAKENWEYNGYFWCINEALFEIGEEPRFQKYLHSKMLEGEKICVGEILTPNGRNNLYKIES